MYLQESSFKIYICSEQACFDHIQGINNRQLTRKDKTFCLLDPFQWGFLVPSLFSSLPAFSTPLTLLLLLHTSCSGHSWENIKNALWYLPYHAEWGRRQANAPPLSFTQGHICVCVSVCVRSAAFLVNVFSFSLVLNWLFPNLICFIEQMLLWV